MKYKYYLFDLDGVIVDTNYIQYISTKNAILDICNYDISTNSDINKIISSTITTYDKLKLLNNLKLVDSNINEYIYIEKKKKADEYFNNLSIDSDKILLFKYLKENKCMIAIVTNGNYKSANIILEKIGIIMYIDLLITNNDINNPKPHPEPYNKAINYFGGKLNEYIIFEDSEIGIQSAKLTGADVCIVKSVNDINLNYIKKYF